LAGVLWTVFVLVLAALGIRELRSSKNCRLIGGVKADDFLAGSDLQAPDIKKSTGDLIAAIPKESLLENGIQRAISLSIQPEIGHYSASLTSRFI